jgi:hypothetical protein
MAQKQILRYGPLRIIKSSAMAHSMEIVTGFNSKDSFHAVTTAHIQIRHRV